MLFEARNKAVVPAAAKNVSESINGLVFGARLCSSKQGFSLPSTGRRANNSFYVHETYLRHLRAYVEYNTYHIFDTCGGGFWFSLYVHGDNIYHTFDICGFSLCVPTCS